STGTIRISTGQVAELSLVHENVTAIDKVAGEIYPDLPEAKTLTGAYEGSCGEEKAILEIEATKVRGHSPDDAGELKGYLISGRFGQSDKETCKSESTCFREFYPEGTFNMLNGNLVLKDGRHKLHCQLVSDALNCDNCRLTQ